MRIRDEQLEKHKKELHFFIACNSYVSCHLSYFSYQYHVRKYIFFIACNSYVSCHLSYFSYQYHVRKYIVL
jgi:hypothetical protein